MSTIPPLIQTIDLKNRMLDGLPWSVLNSTTRSRISGIGNGSRLPGEEPSGWKCFGPVAVGPHETES